MKRQEDWCLHDFKVNQHYWKRRGPAEALDIRWRNLVDLVDVLWENGTRVWLQGGTLRGLARHGTLLVDDHDDDVGVWATDWRARESDVECALHQKGFSRIRRTRSIVSFLRGGRYIDICLFERRGSRAGYGRKWFSSTHFTELDECIVRDRVLPIPQRPAELLKEMYEPGWIRRLSQRASKLWTMRGYQAWYGWVVERVFWRAPHWLRRMMRIPLGLAGMSYVQISESTFLDLCVEPAESFNWKWRRPHLDAVTDGGRCTRIRDIVARFRQEDVLSSQMASVKETDTRTEFYEPVNFDPRFWQSGDNYFLYCMYFGFRKGVTPYAKANEYIKAEGSPPIYTARYYDELPVMGQVEIEKLMRGHPIELTDDAVTSGKHRVFAMIGRLVAQEPYVPVWALKKKGP